MEKLQENKSECQGKQSGSFYQHKSNLKHIIGLILLAIGILLIAGALSTASSEKLISKEELKGVYNILCEQSGKLLYQKVREETEKETPDNAKIDEWNKIAQQPCEQRLTSLFPIDQKTDL